MQINRRSFYYLLRRLRAIKLWQLAVLFLLMLLLSAFLLRQNNLHMLKLRNDVKVADEQSGDVKAALVQLQRYVGTHMNTSLGDKGIYLEQTYQRAYDQAIRMALQTDLPGSAAYQQADHECRGIFSRTSSYPAYIQCVTDKVAALGPGRDPLASVHPPAIDLYRYNFASPLWTPDLAGLCVLIAAVLFIVIAGKVLLGWILSAVLRRRA